MSDTERKELRMVADIKSKAGYVLVLGPGVAVIRTGARSMLYASLTEQGSDAPFLPPSLRRAADL